MSALIDYAAANPWITTTASIFLLIWMADGAMWAADRLFGGTHR